MATSPRLDYGRSSPWHCHNITPWRPGRRHTPPAPPCAPVLLCWHRLHCVSTPLYKRLGYKCPTRTRLHILCKHNTTHSPTVTYLVHYIRHNSNITPYLSHLFLHCDPCRYICHFCFSQTKQRINFKLCRTTKHSNYYVGKNFQIFSCILNAKIYFLIKKILILYIYVGPKNLKVFSHIEVVNFVWSAKFEVYMVFHLRETKKRNLLAVS